jgi:hypothetical protein
MIQLLLPSALTDDDSNKSCVAAAAVAVIRILYNADPWFVLKLALGCVVVLPVVPPE